MLKYSRFMWLAVLWPVFLTVCPAATRKLDQRHRQWLDGPTSYLITKTERAAFLNLPDDKDRDAFIERFWEVRNPAPGSGMNTFKEEFYRRVAWANAHFGNNGGTDGWRTDMGRTWILFGRPRTSTNYTINQNLYPAELWFYSNPGLAELPAFFYVLFFEKDDISGYRLYHPYVDGPAALVRGGPSREQAYRKLYQISPELAQASLTLIPGEPADTDTYSGSMDSARIVNAIRGFREMPSYIATIAARAQRLERVTTHIEYDVAQTALTTLVAWRKGEPWLDWQLAINDPMRPKALGGRARFEVKSRLFAGGQLVFERTDAPAFPVPEAQQDELKRRPFLYEDCVPVVPGRYRLAVTVTNDAAARTYESSKEIVVPAPSDRVLLSDILVVARHDPDRRPRPFQFGGVKFLPSATGITQATRGLGLLYAVELPSPRPAELEVEYTAGSVATKFRKTFNDKLDLRQADNWGALVTAKSLSIEDLPPGVYQLAIRIKDPATGNVSAGSAHFLVDSGEQSPSPIVVSRGAGDPTQLAAANAYERALCWLAQDRPREALGPLETAWQVSRNPAVRGLLVHLYEQTGQKSRARQLLAASSAQSSAGAGTSTQSKREEE